MEVQTEKALWNDTTREQAYHYIEDARDGSSKSEEQIKYEFYDQSDDSETKELQLKAKHDAKYDEIKLKRQINTQEEKIPPRQREMSEEPQSHMKILDEEFATPELKETVNLTNQVKFKINRKK